MPASLPKHTVHSATEFVWRLHESFPQVRVIPLPVSRVEKHFNWMIDPAQSTYDRLSTNSHGKKLNVTAAFSPGMFGTISSEQVDEFREAVHQAFAATNDPHLSGHVSTRRSMIPGRHHVMIWLAASRAVQRPVPKGLVEKLDHVGKRQLPVNFPGQTEHFADRMDELASVEGANALWHTLYPTTFLSKARKTLERLRRKPHAAN